MAKNRSAGSGGSGIVNPAAAAGMQYQPQPQQMYNNYPPQPMQVGGYPQQQPQIVYSPNHQNQQPPPQQQQFQFVQYAQPQPPQQPVMYLAPAASAPPLVVQSPHHMQPQQQHMTTTGGGMTTTGQSAMPPPDYHTLPEASAPPGGPNPSTRPAVMLSISLGSEPSTAPPSAAAAPKPAVSVSTAATEAEDDAAAAAAAGAARSPFADPTRYNEDGTPTNTQSTDASGGGAGSAFSRLCWVWGDADTAALGGDSVLPATTVTPPPATTIAASANDTASTSAAASADASKPASTAAPAAPAAGAVNASARRHRSQKSSSAVRSSSSSKVAVNAAKIEATLPPDQKTASKSRAKAGSAASASAASAGAGSGIAATAAAPRKAIRLAGTATVNSDTVMPVSPLSADSVAVEHPPRLERPKSAGSKRIDSPPSPVRTKSPDEIPLKTCDLKAGDILMVRGFNQVAASQYVARLFAGSRTLKGNSNSIHTVLVTGGPSICNSGVSAVHLVNAGCIENVLQTCHSPNCPTLTTALVYRLSGRHAPAVTTLVAQSAATLIGRVNFSAMGSVKAVFSNAMIGCFLPRTPAGAKANIDAFNRVHADWADPARSNSKERSMNDLSMFCSQFVVECYQRAILALGASLHAAPNQALKFLAHSAINAANDQKSRDAINARIAAAKTGSASPNAVAAVTATTAAAVAIATATAAPTPTSPTAAAAAAVASAAGNEPLETPPALSLSRPPTHVQLRGPIRTSLTTTITNTPPAITTPRATAVILGASAVTTAAPPPLVATPSSADASSDSITPPAVMSPATNVHPSSSTGLDSLTSADSAISPAAAASAAATASAAGASALAAVEPLPPATSSTIAVAVTSAAVASPVAAAAVTVQPATIASPVPAKSAASAGSTANFISALQELALVSPSPEIDAKSPAPAPSANSSLPVALPVKPAAATTTTATGTATALDSPAGRKARPQRHNDAVGAPPSTPTRAAPSVHQKLYDELRAIMDVDPEACSPMCLEGYLASSPRLWTPVGLLTYSFVCRCTPPLRPGMKPAPVVSSDDDEPASPPRLASNIKSSTN